VHQIDEGHTLARESNRQNYSDELFIKAARNEIKCLVVWGNICALNRHAPAPLDERRLNSSLPQLVDRTTDESVRLYEALLKK